MHNAITEDLYELWHTLLFDCRLKMVIQVVGGVDGDGSASDLR